LEPRKNIELLIRAYSRLVLEDHWKIPLVLAGRKGWKMDGLLSNVPEIVRNQIYFTGFISDEDLPVVYKNASLFVFPSIYEGFGLPPLEALACGTRVLSSDAASLPEVLGEAAMYFESNNEQALYQALKEAVLSEQKPEQIKNGELQAACFDWNQQAQILLDRLRGLFREQ
jgi:glycosyltransferase involved in cell wall biosynthesis